MIVRINPFRYNRKFRAREAPVVRMRIIRNGSVVLTERNDAVHDDQWLKRTGDGERTRCTLCGNTFLNHVRARRKHLESKTHQRKLKENSDAER